MDPLRPPPGISAARFFGEWLPQAFAGSGNAGFAAAPAVRVTLSGEGGGDWRIRATEDGLEIEALAPGRQAEVDVWLRQSSADFLAVFEPGPDLPELLPAGWTAL